MRPLLLVALVSGCVSPVVGAECRPGLTACDARCVDLTSDRQHCGACGLACPAGDSCRSGRCVVDSVDAEPLELDGGIASADAGPSTPRLRPEPTRDDARVPAVRHACELGELACGDECVRAASDPEHCGGCGRACAPGESCGGGACRASCSAPWVSCGGSCVDTQVDPDHCGGCGVRCDTGVCVEGTCASPAAGHLVVIGHDYASRRDAMSRIVGNAALLPPRRTVRLLAYEGTATAESRAGVTAAIDATARETGRAWAYEPVLADLLSYRLAFADVLVVHAQPDLGAGTASGLGRDWQLALRSFLERGGTVVALVAAGAPNGTLTVLESAGLLRAPSSAPTEITGALLNVVRSSDAVAVGVPLAYRAERATVRLPLDLDATVVTDGVGPVVWHRAVVPSIE